MDLPTLEEVVEEVEKIRKYIQYCITKYKTKEQTIDLIAKQANINPVCTKEVWEELERQNSDFFRWYYKRLKLIDHINRFNSLLEIQAKLMERDENEPQQQPTTSQQRDGLLQGQVQGHGQEQPMHRQDELQHGRGQRFEQEQLMHRQNGLRKPDFDGSQS